jgi:hypothetical protein
LGAATFKNAVIALSGIDGKLIQSNTYHNISTTSIDLCGKPKGMYVVSIIVDGEKLNKKISIE